jgi:FecR-like protein
MNEIELEMDQDIERLSTLLNVYRCTVPRPDFSRVRIMRPRRHWPLAVAAAILAICVLGGWLFLRQPATWTASTVAGSVRVPHRIAAGDTIRTDALSRVRLQSRAIGVVDVGQQTTLKIDSRQRLSLIAGTIHARTKSAPGIFVVDTPHARAVDLGCEYILTIAADGSGILTVAAGWVALNALAMQSLVPQGAAARIRADGRLTAPYFDDAPTAFRDAVQQYSFGDDRELATILALARRRDAFTLLNLFRIASPGDRIRVYDRLNQLVPAPASIPRDAMRNWQWTTTDPWWPVVIKATGLQAIKKPRSMESQSLRPHHS